MVVGEALDWSIGVATVGEVAGKFGAGVVLSAMDSVLTSFWPASEGSTGSGWTL